VNSISPALTSARASINKRSKSRIKFPPMARRTTPTSLSSATSTRISATPQNPRKFFKDAIARNPDNDHIICPLHWSSFAAATWIRPKPLCPRDLNASRLRKILWGLGIVSALRGNSVQAAERLERAVDLLPEWPGSYSTLGVFYYQTGQYAKAREVLDRFKGSHSRTGLDVSRIEQALANAPPTSASTPQPLPMAARQQLLQVAFSLADRTL